MTVDCVGDKWIIEWLARIESIDFLEGNLGHDLVAKMTSYSIWT